MIIPLLLQFMSLAPCEQPVDEGPCEGNFERWFYDNQTDVCRPFVYGGCKGNKNNYATEHSCNYHCRQPGVHKGLHFRTSYIELLSCKRLCMPLANAPNGYNYPSFIGLPIYFYSLVMDCIMLMYPYISFFPFLCMLSLLALCLLVITTILHPPYLTDFCDRRITSIPIIHLHELVR